MVSTVLILLSSKPFVSGFFAGNTWLMPSITSGKNAEDEPHTIVEQSKVQPIESSSQSQALSHVKKVIASIWSQEGIAANVPCMPALQVFDLQSHNFLISFLRPLFVLNTRVLACSYHRQRDRHVCLA